MADNQYTDWDQVNAEYNKRYSQLEEQSDRSVADRNHDLTNAMVQVSRAHKYADQVEHGNPATGGYDRNIDDFINEAQKTIKRIGPSSEEGNASQFGGNSDEDRHYIAATYQPLTKYMLNQADANGVDHSSSQYMELTDLNNQFDAWDELPCFTGGTLINTPQGEVLVEELSVGDVVNTLSGPRELKWIGHRHFSNLAGLPEGTLKDKSAPVMFRAHSLADGMPSCDMRVSPWHHMYVQGVLVRAMDLVNGQTIYTDTSVNAVTYYHLELDGDFDVIESCGTYSESFADNGKNRRGFFSSEGVVDLRPVDAQMGGMSPRPGFTVVRPNRNGQVLTEIQQHFAARCQQLLEYSAELDTYSA